MGDAPMERSCQGRHTTGFKEKKTQLMKEQNEQKGSQEKQNKTKEALLARNPQKEASKMKFICEICSSDTGAALLSKLILAWTQRPHGHCRGKPGTKEIWWWQIMSERGCKKVIMISKVLEITSLQASEVAKAGGKSVSAIKLFFKNFPHQPADEPKHFTANMDCGVDVLPVKVSFYWMIWRPSCSWQGRKRS